MIQSKLEYANGQPWDDRHGLWDIRWVSNELIQQNYPPKLWEEFRDMLEEALEGYDSFDKIYLFGYMRFHTFNLDIEDSLEDALSRAYWGAEDNFCAPEFVIDPYNKAIYLHPHYDDATPTYLIQ